MQLLENVLNIFKKEYTNKEIVKIINSGIEEKKFFIDVDSKEVKEKDINEILLSVKNQLDEKNIININSISAINKEQENIQIGTKIEINFFINKAEFEEYEKSKEAIVFNDHREIGKRLGLFTFSNQVGKGLPLYTEKGAALRRVLENFVVEEETKRGYKHVVTPDIASIDLYKKSGHYPYYKDSMYSPIKIDDEEFILRPMTCPHHFELYLSSPKSYKDLPFKIAELSKLYRYEKSGELTGLTRVRSFCLSDAHIICKDVTQAKEEIINALDLIEYGNKILGFERDIDYWYRLSLGDRSDISKFYKNNEAWEESEKILREVLEERNCKYKEEKGDAAFYGPKIDIQILSIAGKEDTAFTVQYDFVMPERFNLEYVGKDGKKHRPIVIHRSFIGSIERVLAFLIEKYKGKFPFWMSPVQVKVLTVSEDANEFAKKVAQELLENNIRIESDFSDSKLGHKLYLAKTELVPYIIIIGENDIKNNQVTLEKRDGEKSKLSIDELLKRLLKENKEKL